MGLDKRAEVGLPLQAIIELILISVVAVAMLSFVSKLDDNTEFQQKMLGREAALSATVAASSPASSYVRMVHQNVPMDLFNFSLENNLAGIRFQDDTITYPFPSMGPLARQMERSNFIVNYDGQLSMSDRPLPSPLKQGCPKVLPSQNKIYVAAASSTESEEAIKPVIESLLRETPSALIQVIAQRTLEGLFSSREQQSRIIQQKQQPTISLQFVQGASPQIRYDLNSANIQETKKLACALSNELSTVAKPVPMIPVNAEIIDAQDSRAVLDDAEIIVQVVLPPTIDLLILGSTAQDNEQHLKQGIYKAIEVYFS